MSIEGGLSRFASLKKTLQEKQPPTRGDVVRLLSGESEDKALLLAYDGTRRERLNAPEAKDIDYAAHDLHMGLLYLDVGRPSAIEYIQGSLYNLDQMRSNNPDAQKLFDQGVARLREEGVEYDPQSVIDNH